MQEEVVIRKAVFNPKVKNYWVLSSVLLFVVTIFGIPLLLIWLPIALAVCGRYLASLECVLTNKAVKLKSGVWNKVEKTIPLDKITDMGLLQGPIMRAMDLQRLTVETAGSSAPGALASVIGVIDARGFRDAVMKQKELLAAGNTGSEDLAPAAAVGLATPGVSSDAESIQLLREIRDSLYRLEGRAAGGG
jgi:putative membrane protein